MKHSNHPLLGISRDHYELESALNDGECVHLHVSLDRHFVALRFTPDIARQLAKDLVAVAAASEKWITKHRLRGKAKSKKKGATA